MPQNTSVSLVLSAEERQELTALQEKLQKQLQIGKITQRDAIRFAIRSALKNSK